ncbi:hypothetical protein [Absidia glauca]|uniref:RRM domain-containing protein n=1 Tax=Absidia glauca TaxID=4829 RepID=A0A163IWF6_ABSGL|nr:hypothetical protein [Absidia glauca]
MAADPPPSRRIHVNPKFAGARPPPAQSNNQAEKEAEQRRIVEQLRSEQAERRRRQTEDQARLTQQKRPVGHHESDQHNTASPLDSTQRSPYKRRIDTASEPTRSHEVPLPSSFQSRLGRGTHEAPASVSKRDPSLVPSRPNGGNGFSIRGAAAAAAASTNTRVRQDKTGHQDHHNKSANERPLSFRSVSSSGDITNRLGTNNQQQQQQQQTPTRGHRIDNKETILQRLGGGKITNKMAKKNDTSTDRPKPSSSSPSNNASNLTPIFANGKSSKLILSNLPSQVTESSLKSLEPKDIKLVSLDRGNKSATLLFTAIDSAVTFRRKYNRTMLSGEHILVSFAKN